MNAVSIAVATNSGPSRLDGAPNVGLAATYLAAGADDEPGAVSFIAGVGRSSDSKAWASGSGSADGAVGWGGASNKKPTPKKTPTVAAPTAAREMR